MFGTAAALRPAAPRTFLVIVSILSLLLASLTLVFAQPAHAAAPFTVFATTTDCNATALHKQIDWSGNDSVVIGSMNSNAGITLSGARNNVTGSVTYNGSTDPAPTCEFVTNDADHSGGLLSPTSAAPTAASSYAVPTPAECTFNFTSDVDLHTQDGGPGEQNVWEADGTTLKTGQYCVTGKLQQSRQHTSGTVSFFATGHIDLSNGSNTDLAPFRPDGVLLYSTADGFDAVTVAGSGSDVVPGNSDHSFYRGIVFAPNGEAETGGQHITIGCIEAETVKLNGSNHIIQGCGEEPPPPPPVVAIEKVNDTTGPVPPGTEVDFTLTVTVLNNIGEDVTVVDDIPVGFDDPAPADIQDGGTFASGEITWVLDSPTDGTYELNYTLTVSDDVEDGDELTNVAVVTSPESNCPPESAELGEACIAESTVVVVIPPPAHIEITKVNNSAATVPPGTAVGFTLTVAVTVAPASSVTVVDTLPDGYDAPTSISNSGTFSSSTNKITWNLGNLAIGNHTLTYTAAVSSDVANGTVLTNVAVVTSPGSNCPAATTGGVCDDDSVVTVVVPPLVPLLLIDKTASATTITISGAAGAQTASPSSVTWTLNYTLTNGPVTNAVITDPLPAGFDFVSASNSGTFNATTRTITWNLGTLTTSGSVTFVTNVNVATISRTGPTVNIATIDSTQTAPDTGQDDVAVSVSAELASTGTPGSSTAASSLPNTAFDIGALGAMTIPLAFLVLLVVGSLGGFAYANIRSVRRRQR